MDQRGIWLQNRYVGCRSIRLEAPRPDSGHQSNRAKHARRIHRFVPRHSSRYNRGNTCGDRPTRSKRIQIRHYIGVDFNGVAREAEIVANIDNERETGFIEFPAVA
jgi:hypothetical protein